MGDVPTTTHWNLCFSMIERLLILATLWENTSMGHILIAGFAKTDQSHGYWDHQIWVRKSMRKRFYACIAANWRNFELIYNNCLFNTLIHILSFFFSTPAFIVLYRLQFAFSNTSSYVNLVRHDMTDHLVKFVYIILRHPVYLILIILYFIFYVVLFCNLIIVCTFILNT